MAALARLVVTGGRGICLGKAVVRINQSRLLLLGSVLSVFLIKSGQSLPVRCPGRRFWQQVRVPIWRVSGDSGRAVGTGRIMGSPPTLVSMETHKFHSG